MTDVDVDITGSLDGTAGGPVDEGGFTPEGPGEQLTSSPAAPPGPFEPDGPISRADVLVRAQSWVDEQVPYSQTSKHTNDFGSYRADCSGFVSMAWRLSASLTTFSLPDVMTDIARSDLTAGDALWRRQNGEGHVALFLRWADAERTIPVVQEEYDFGEVAEERTWTKAWASAFTPKRYRRITDDGPAAAARTALVDGALVQAPGTPVAVLAGGARIPLASSAEVAAIGADGDPVHTLTKADYLDLPTIPADGTLLSGKPGLPAALVIGGARLNLAGADEITETGHGDQPVLPVPARAFRAMTSRMADGTLIAATGLPVAVLVGGARINLQNADEIAAVDSGTPVRQVPRRVFTGLDGRIEDGTLVTAPGLPIAVIVGGGRINFQDGDEVVATGNNRKPVRTLPRRVFNGLSGRIEDGTLIGAPGLPAALVVGGARVNLRDADEITALGLGGRRVQLVPERVFTGLSGTIEDGTLVRTPESAQVWRLSGGRRAKVGGGAAQLVPQRVLDTFPVA